MDVAASRVGFRGGVGAVGVPELDGFGFEVEEEVDQKEDGKEDEDEECFELGGIHVRVDVH